MTTLNSKITISKEALFRDLEGEAVLLHLETGKYYGLDEIGARMWNLLVEHGKVEPVYRKLLDEYDVTDEQLQQDLFKLIDELTGHELLQIVQT